MRNKTFNAALLFIALLWSSTSYAQRITSGYASVILPSGSNFFSSVHMDMTADGKFDVCYKETTGATNLPQCFERVYSNSNTPLFASEQLVNNNGPSAKANEAPSVAMNNNGTYVIAYMENNNAVPSSSNYYSIYFQKYFANGTKNGLRVLVDNGMYPDIDMADDGTFNIIYQSGHSSTNPAVKVLRYNAAYASLGSPIIVSASSGTGDRNPRIRSQSANKFVASYFVPSSGAAQIGWYASSGSQLGGTIVLPSAYSSDWVDLAVKPNGNLVALFTEVSGANRNYKIVRYNYLSTTPSSTVLHYSGTIIVRWSIGINSNGDYVICYPNTLSHGLQTQVVQQFDVNDNIVGPQYPIMSDPPGESLWYYYTNPYVTVGNCRYGVAWLDKNTTGPSRIAYEIFTVMQTGPVANAGPDKNANDCCPGCNVVTIGTAGTAGFTYTWTPTTYMTPSNGIAAQPTITYPLNNFISYVDYTLTITSALGCFVSSDAMRVTYAPCRAEDATAADEFLISPNPSDGIFNVFISSSGNDVLQFSVIDISGKVIMNEKINSNEETEIDMAEYPAGFYYCRILNEVTHEQQVKKIVIE